MSLRCDVKTPVVMPSDNMSGAEYELAFYQDGVHVMTANVTK